VYSFKGEVPIYLQLMDEIKGGIAAGKLLPGEKIASIRELAAFYAVNPNTVQRALLELEREGLLSTKRASGKTVTEDMELVKNLKENLAAEKLIAFISAMENLGYSPDETAVLFNTMLKERSSGQKEAAQ
jgi:DNA-binding transcriptional regulator YhcF (GntR family)